MTPPKSMKDWAKRSIVGLAEIVTPDPRWPARGERTWYRNAAAPFIV